jgi:hypothetical protein
MHKYCPSQRNCSLDRKRPILFSVLHPDNFSKGEAMAPKAQRLGLWWRKNYQRDAQKNKISLELLPAGRQVWFFCFKTKEQVSFTQQKNPTEK